jgi:hypothetical protein
MRFSGFRELDKSSVADYSGQTDLASTEAYEAARSCGPERTYLLAGVEQISPMYRLNRPSVSETTIGKQCVNYIMKNFTSLKQRSEAYARCSVAQDGTPSEPSLGTDKDGHHPPCVTESYVNATYHALVDVSDCLNIPMGEMLPKLFNESGLHTNTLGGGFDAGVGQLTVSALREVFMSYNGIETNPSSLGWYLKEIAKSQKPSCQRIAADPSIGIQVPKGKRVCKLNEADAESKLPVDQQTCFKPWSKTVRCVVMDAPSSPLRNVLYMGVFYRAMLRSVTGINYSAGNDVLNGQPYTGVEKLTGYLGRNNYVERMKNLGATKVDEKVLRQILISVGFNAGIDTGNVLLNAYLKQKEAKNTPVKDSDFDFQNVATGKWAIVTNLATFWRGLGSEDIAEFNKAMTSLEVLKEVGGDVVKAQEMYKKLREVAYPERAAIEQMQFKDEDEKELAVNRLKAKYDVYRHPLLAVVFAKADELSFPEFMRIAHADKIVKSPGTGGAPGYVSFLANKHKQLEAEMGARTCTVDKYLQF